MSQTEITPAKITNDFSIYFDNIARFINIENEQDYEDALNLIEYLMDIVVEEDVNRPTGILLDLIVRGIERYEAEDPEIIEFQKKCDELEDYGI